MIALTMSGPARLAKINHRFHPPDLPIGVPSVCPTLSAVDTPRMDSAGVCFYDAWRGTRTPERTAAQ